MNKFKINAKIRNIFNDFFNDIESEKLNRELRQRILKIKADNYKYIIDKLVPYYEEIFNLDEDEALGASNALFLRGIKTGKIDKHLNYLNIEEGAINEKTNE